MARKGKKSFTIRDPYDLLKVDTWWANLLRKSPRQIDNVIWYSNGDLSWILELYWSNVSLDSSVQIIIGTPAFSTLSTEYLTKLIEICKDEINDAHEQLSLLEQEIISIGVVENTDIPLEEADFFSNIDPFLTFPEETSEFVKIMVSEYLWPKYISSKKSLLAIEMSVNEMVAESNARQSSNYLPVSIDRGMLRRAFIDTLGYDNGIIFDIEDIEAEIEEDE